MPFTELCDSILSSLLFENFSINYIAKINYEIESLKTKLRGNRSEFRLALKVIKKKLISKLIQSNYKSMLSDFFTHLERQKSVSDDAFYNLLFQNPDNWSGMTEDIFRRFAEKMEGIINYFAELNNHQYENIKYLRHTYVK
jgi:hypothetical protein